MEGQAIRFCQQCGHFHRLEEFDGDSRSCRIKVSQHQDQRRVHTERTVSRFKKIGSGEKYDRAPKAFSESAISRRDSRRGQKRPLEEQELLWESNIQRNELAIWNNNVQNLYNSQAARLSSDDGSAMMKRLKSLYDRPSRPNSSSDLNRIERPPFPEGHSIPPPSYSIEEGEKSFLSKTTSNASKEQHVSEGRMARLLPFLQNLSSLPFTKIFPGQKAVKTIPEAADTTQDPKPSFNRETEPRDWPVPSTTFPDSVNYQNTNPRHDGKTTEQAQQPRSDVVHDNKAKVRVRDAAARVLRAQASGTSGTVSLHHSSRKHEHQSCADNTSFSVQVDSNTTMHRQRGLESINVQPGVRKSIDHVDQLDASGHAQCSGPLSRSDSRRKRGTSRPSFSIFSAGPFSCASSDIPEQEVVVLSAKLFGSSPDRLPEGLIASLKNWMSKTPTYVEIAKRPGCVHLSYTLLMSKEDRMEWLNLQQHCEPVLEWQTLMEENMPSRGSVADLAEGLSSSPRTDRGGILQPHLLSFLKCMSQSGLVQQGIVCLFQINGARQLYLAGPGDEVENVSNNIDFEYFSFLKIESRNELDYRNSPPSDSYNPKTARPGVQKTYIGMSEQPHDDSPRGTSTTASKSVGDADWPEMLQISKESEFLESEQTECEGTAFQAGDEASDGRDLSMRRFPENYIIVEGVRPLRGRQCPTLSIVIPLAATAEYDGPFWVIGTDFNPCQDVLFCINHTGHVTLEVQAGGCVNHTACLENNMDHVRNTFKHGDESICDDERNDRSPKKVSYETTDGGRTDKAVAQAFLGRPSTIPLDVTAFSRHQCCNQTHKKTQMVRIPRLEVGSYRLEAQRGLCISNFVSVLIMEEPSAIKEVRQLEQEWLWHCSCFHTSTTYDTLKCDKKCNVDVPQLLVKMGIVVRMDQALRLCDGDVGMAASSMDLPMALLPRIGVLAMEVASIAYERSWQRISRIALHVVSAVSGTR